MFQPWPNKYNKVTMDKYCFILFFINKKYFDNIWYNTVVMSMYYLEKKKKKRRREELKRMWRVFIICVKVYGRTSP
jgi:hypothetical protein